MWNCLCLRNYEKRWRKIAASMRKWRGVTQIVYIEQLWVDSQKGSSMKHNKISKPMTRTLPIESAVNIFFQLASCHIWKCLQAKPRQGWVEGGLESNIGPQFDVMVCGWLDVGRQEDTVYINAHWLHLLWEVVKPKCWPNLKCELEREVWRNFPVVIFTLFSPPYFCVSKEGGEGSNICPPLYLGFGLDQGF